MADITKDTKVKPSLLSKPVTPNAYGKLRSMLAKHFGITKVKEIIGKTHGKDRHEVALNLFKVFDHG